jgi:hypothetical protein
MMYLTFNCEEADMSGHIEDKIFNDGLIKRLEHYEVTEVQADGDELERCCEILGRELPPNRVYTFLGVNAQEIARNWM